jgi:hypothetical protein
MEAERAPRLRGFMAPYLLALLIVAVALVLGNAVCRACGLDGGIAPAVGLGTLTAVAALSIRLPGDAVTAAVVVALVSVVALAWLVRGALGRPDPAAILAGLGAVAIVSLQFLSANRMGIPGVSVNNDTAAHLLWAEGLRSDLMEHLYPWNKGYPLGPHAVISAIAQGTGAGADDVLIGLLIATPALMAATVAAALRPMPWLWRAPAAAFVALTYLGAAWFAQGAFKEPLMSLYLLSYALLIGTVLAPGFRVRRASLVPAGLLVAGSLLTYSYLALAWLGAATVLALAATLVLRRPSRAGTISAARAAAVPVGVGVAVAIAAVAVELPRLWFYLRTVGGSPAGGSGGIDAANLGNLIGPLPIGEVLGIWPVGDFRYSPGPHWYLLELRAVALVVVIGGCLYLLDRRRDIGLLAALGAAVAVWLISDRGQSPYVTAKSLVILSPFVALVGLRAVLPESWPSVPRARVVALARIGLAAIFVGAGLWSSQMVLRGTAVESTQQRDQLQSLRPLVKPGPTLFLGVDDYVPYRLRNMTLGYIGAGFVSPIPLTPRPEKPWAYGQPVDWDTFDAATLDRFAYVVSVRSAYASQAPPNFKLIGSTPLYDAWRRTGPTQPRSTLEAGDSPVSILNCKTRPGRRLSRRQGVASVDAAVPVPIATTVPGLPLGAAYQVGVTLPPGTWDIAARYTSDEPIRIMYGPTKLTTLPPNTDRPGPWWPAGRIVTDGHAQQIVLIAERESRFSGAFSQAAIAGLVAVKAGQERVVALKRACGRAVDWYQAR